MPKFAANPTMLCAELPFLDRFAAAREAGFHAVEYLFPCEHPKEELAARLRAHGLKQVLHNLPAGDCAGGIQVADNPGRNEPGTGGINSACLFRHPDAIGGKGYVGCEYKARAGTAEGLGWMKELAR